LYRRRSLELFRSEKRTIETVEVIIQGYLEKTDWNIILFSVPFATGCGHVAAGGGIKYSKAMILSNNLSSRFLGMNV
jgi:hypothetical protein